MNDLILAIKTYVIDPENPEYNYQLALAYDKIDQTASASTFYMRAAELTDIKELSYECLIKFATCLCLSFFVSTTPMGNIGQT